MMEKTVSDAAVVARGENLNVKKKKAPVGTCFTGPDPVRRALLVTGEFYRGLAEASAEAFRAFDNELQHEQVQSSGLTNSVVDGIAEGNVRFFEAMAASSRRLFERLREDTKVTTEVVASQIDYERLAKLVAAELKKSDQKI